MNQENPFLYNKKKMTNQKKFKFLVTMALLLTGARSINLQCDVNLLRSPINLDMPLPFEKFEPMLHFVKPDHSLTMKKLTSDTYLLEGNFGFVSFLGNTRKVKKVYFKSPSEHSVSGVRFAMEMQIYAPGDKKNSGIVISKLFEKSRNKNGELNMLGFGSGKLRSTSVGGEFTVVNPIGLSQVIGDGNAFINYQGEATGGDCEMVEWLIDVETGEVGGGQIKEFVKDMANKVKPKIPLSSVRITQNFNEKVKLKVKKRTKDIKPLSKVWAKRHSEAYKKKMEEKKKREQKEKERKKKLEEMKKKALERMRKKKAEEKRKEEERKKKEAQEKKRKAEAKKKALELAKKKKAEEAKRLKEKQKKKVKLPKKSPLKLHKTKSKSKPAKKKAKTLKKLHRLPFVTKKSHSQKMFEIIKIKGRGHILGTPKESVMPWRIHSRNKLQRLIQEGAIIINTSPKLFPKLKQKHLQWRVVYFYKSRKKLELTPNGLVRFIPFIAKVPKDYNPPTTMPTMALPFYNDMTKRIAVKHLRKVKSLDKWEQRVEQGLQKKRVCLKWKLKIKIDKKGNAIRGRKCKKWVWVNSGKGKTFFERKDKNLLNSMGSMKWVVKGLTGMIHR